MIQPQEWSQLAPGRRPNGLGAACAEAQADGVPCGDVQKSCSECARNEQRGIESDFDLASFLGSPPELPKNPH